MRDCKKGAAMELRQIRYFLAVADTLHFGKAAQRLHMAEQPLSFQIKKLEQELGFKLFARTTRRVSLTPAGELFRARASSALEELERGVEVAAKTAAGERGRLVVAYDSSAIHGLLPRCVRVFKDRYPEVELSLVERSRPDLTRTLADLAEGAVDLDLALLYDQVPADVACEVIQTDQVMVAMPAGHRLAQEQAVPLASLQDERFLTYASSQTAAHSFIERLCRAAGFEPKVEQEAETYMSLLGLVASGMGVTMATSSFQGMFAGQVEFRPLVEPSLAVKVALLSRAEGAMPAAERFVATARMVSLRLGAA